jgi:putative acetyltransferase
MHQPYRIEHAGPVHVPGICRTHRAAILELARDHYPPDQLAAWATLMKPEKMERALTEPDKILLVALAEREVAGFCLFAPGRVWALYVRPEHAGQGLGSRLLAQAEATARRQGQDRLQLTASRNAVQFYEARGFRPTGEDVFPLGGGLTLACIHMEKSLGALEGFAG